MCVTENLLKAEVVKQLEAVSQANSAFFEEQPLAFSDFSKKDALIESYHNLQQRINSHFSLTRLNSANGVIDIQQLWRQRWDQEALIYLSYAPLLEDWSRKLSEWHSVWGNWDKIKPWLGLSVDMLFAIADLLKKQANLLNRMQHAAWWQRFKQWFLRKKDLALDKAKSWNNQLQQAIVHNQQQQMLLRKSMLIKLQVMVCTGDLTNEDLLGVLFRQARTKGLVTRSYTIPAQVHLREESFGTNFTKLNHYLWQHGDLSDIKCLRALPWFNSTMTLSLIPLIYWTDTYYPVPAMLFYARNQHWLKMLTPYVVACNLSVHRLMQNLHSDWNQYDSITKHPAYSALENVINHFRFIYEQADTAKSFPWWKRGKWWPEYRAKQHFKNQLEQVRPRIADLYIQVLQSLATYLLKSGEEAEQFAFLEKARIEMFLYLAQVWMGEDESAKENLARINEQIVATIKERENAFNQRKNSLREKKSKEHDSQGEFEKPRNFLDIFHAEIKQAIIQNKEFHLNFSDRTRLSA